MTRRKILAAAVAAVAVITAAGCAAQDAPAAAIQGAPVHAGQPVLPGHSRKMSVWIGNCVPCGSVGSPEYLQLRIRRLSPRHGRRVMPPAWVKFTGLPVLVGPGKGVTVTFTLAVPPNALPGEYMNNVEVDTVAGPEPGGVGGIISTGANTYIRFTVAG